MLSPNVEITEKSHTIRIDWNQNNMPWNEICAKVLEVFGLPGSRYTSHPTTYYMVFKFNSEKDYTLCKVLLSEYL